MQQNSLHIYFVYVLYIIVYVQWNQFHAVFIWKWKSGKVSWCHDLYCTSCISLALTVQIIVYYSHSSSSHLRKGPSSRHIIDVFPSFPLARCWRERGCTNVRRRSFTASTPPPTTTTQPPLKVTLSSPLISTASRPKAPTPAPPVAPRLITH